MEQSRTTTSTAQEQSTTTETIGFDGQGARHEYDPAERTVFVFASTGTLEHTQQLETRPVADWIDYVATKRGWRDRRFLTARDLFGDA